MKTFSRAFAFTGESCSGNQISSVLFNIMASFIPSKWGSWKKSSKYKFLKEFLDGELESDLESLSGCSEIFSTASEDSEINFSDFSNEFESRNDKESSVPQEKLNVVVNTSSQSSPEGSSRDDRSDVGSVNDESNWSDRIVSSSDGEDETELITNDDLKIKNSYTVRDALRTYAIQCNVPHNNLRMLMNLLRPLYTELPRDPRTILKRPAKIVVEPMDQGLYYYFGIENMLQKILRNKKYVPATLTLDFNVDGLPLSKSSNVQLWPILCRIDQLRSAHPFIVGVYCGAVKPPIHDFFKDFAPELKNLQLEGVSLNGCQYQILSGHFICDAPARAYVKGVKSHTGYYGCDRCVQRGQWEGRVTFPEVDAELRTDGNFTADIAGDHVLTGSPLCGIGIGMISQFPQEIMHLVYLGTVRKMVRYWIKGSLKYRLSSNIVNLIDRDLKCFGKLWPNDFNRKPRSISEVDRWKATEGRQFLLYLGPIVLRKFLPALHYELFMLLHVGITILVRADLHRRMNSLAQTFLKRFILKCIQLFGSKFMSYNIHSLIHLPMDVAVNGPADSFSAFPFENKLGSIKISVRGRNKPLQHLVRRTLQQLEFESSDDKEPLEGTIETSRHSRGPVCGLNGAQYCRIRWNQTILTNKEGNNVVIMKDSTVIIIDNFIRTDDDILIVGRKFSKNYEFFSAPVRSSKLGIFRVEKCRNRSTITSLREVEWKAILLTLTKNSHVCYPLQT